MVAKLSSLLAAMCVIAAVVHAGPSATVVSVTGQAFRQDADGGAWQPASVGDVVSSEAMLRTGTGSSIVLLRADGALLRVSSDAARKVESLSTPSDKGDGWHFLDMLRELFGDPAIERKGASRGIVQPGGDEAPQHRYAARYGALLGKARLEQEDIPLVLQTAAYFDQERQHQKVVALLDRLGRDFGERPGFAPLAEWARQAESQRTWLRLHKFVGSKVSPVEPGEVLHSGSGVQVAYASDRESYLYLVVHSVPQDGRVSSLRIYPDNLTAAKPVPARTELRLPSQEAFFLLDDQTGTEYLTAWSCEAPLEDTRALERLIDGIAERLRRGAPLSDEVVQGIAPSGCSRGFVRAFEHGR